MNPEKFVGGELLNMPTGPKSLQERDKARLAAYAAMLDAASPVLEETKGPDTPVSRRAYMPTDARGDQKKLSARRKANKVARKTRRKQRA